MTAVVGAAAALVVLAVVLRLVVSGRLRVRYAGLWLAVGVATAVLALIPHLLTGLSGALGFRVPANFLFFGGLILLIVIGIHLSVAVTSLEDRVQRLAEEFALHVEGGHRPPGEPAAPTDPARTRTTSELGPGVGGR